MTGTRTQFIGIIRRLGIYVTIAVALATNIRSAQAVVKIFDGFGDADRNNDGSILADTDLNDNGSHNVFTGTPPTATGADSGLANRGITEVTVAMDPDDAGIVWSGIRSFDTTNNDVKSKLKIINDSVATGVETSAEIHNDGLALGVESRGGGSSFIGRFGQSIALGPVAGDKVVATVDWRVWREANNNLSQPSANNVLRWGLYQDTDGEFGQTAGYGDNWLNNGGGQNGALVMWGRDDGKWFDSSPGAEGDKGINTELTFGAAAVSSAARIRWETNVRNINSGTNDGRILEGTAPSNTIGGGGGDTSTVATPGTDPNTDPGDGPGGIIDNGDENTFAPHTLKLEIVRLADGLVQVASFIDATEVLRDEIKTTDTGYNVIAPIPFTYDYVAFRNATNDWDYVIDNFMVEVFGSNAGLLGDFNNDGKVDAGDYATWRKNDGTNNALANDNNLGTPIGAAHYNLWRSNFGNPAGSGASLDAGAVPEPAAVLILLIGGLLAVGSLSRNMRCAKPACVLSIH